jgi:hypothetical protein
VAKAEAGLFRRRRSKWLIATGLAAWILATGVALWPKVARDGWWTVTPTIALIWMWPDVPEFGAAAPAPGAGTTPGVRAVPAAAAGGWPVTAGAGVPGEAKTGVEAILSRRLRDWERRALVRRCAAVLDTSADPRDRAVLLGWLNQMKTAEIVPALPALARAAARDGLVPLRGGGMPMVGRGPMAGTVTITRPVVQTVMLGGGARLLIREVAAICTNTAGVVARADAAGAGAEGVARIAWSVATGLPERDEAVVAKLAAFSLDDPLLLPDGIVERMLKDEQARGRLLKTIARSMDALVESADRCERLLVGVGPAAVAAIPELLVMAQDHKDRRLGRAAFRILGAIGPEALPDAGGTLEGWAEGVGDDEGIGFRALWAGITLATLREDVPMLVRALSEALEPTRDWDVRHEALAMLHARTPHDGLIVARVLLAAEHESTLLQLAAVEALGRLSQSQPDLQRQIERLAREGKPRAKEASQAFLSRVKSEASWK